MSVPGQRTIMNRRDYLRGTLGVIGGAMVPLSPGLAATSTQAPKPTASKEGNIVLCELTAPGRLTTTMLQMGLTHVIASMRLQGTVEQQAEQVARIKGSYETAGLKIVGVESAPVSYERMKLGLDGRDEEIQNFINAI